ncbi:hypothetical protein LSH36_424g00047 [Paralvinella palmiformis]|uniref:Uncharacterized protein n=1 Tax=Paralvinella palmiformis TaxID=53620 RepID=A0AAD9JCJ2_9ANNE|nr:hypothetical protein LSH36_424g00047 [Paralvinella palmiformis]
MNILCTVVNLRTTIVYYKPIDSPHCILKADVTPSQRVNDTPHDPRIGLHEKDRIVTAAHCDCMAGLGFRQRCGSRLKQQYVLVTPDVGVPSCHATGTMTL